jgi:hypothetical protein
MSKTKGQTFRCCFGTKPKRFWYRSQICLIENRWFRFGPESALLDQIEIIAFNKTKFEKELKPFGFIPIRYRNVCGAFVEHLWNICGTFVERLWNVCGTFVERLWKIVERLMNVCGTFVERLWNICGTWWNICGAFVERL